MRFFPAAFLRQAGAEARRLGMSKPVILAVDDPGARYLLLTARVAAAAGEGAMSVCFLHRYLAAI